MRENAAVELSLADGALVIQPVKSQPLTLVELLRGVTDDNLPGEWDANAWREIAEEFTWPSKP